MSATAGSNIYNTTPTLIPYTYTYLQNYSQWSHTVQPCQLHCFCSELDSENDSEYREIPHMKCCNCGVLYAKKYIEGLDDEAYDTQEPQDEDNDDAQGTLFQSETTPTTFSYVYTTDSIFPLVSVNTPHIAYTDDGTWSISHQNEPPEETL